MTLPDFLVIGGKKCGTTALFRLLRQHPELCLPQKEVHFFSYEGIPPPLPHVVTDFPSYEALFADCSRSSRCGEASPSYLHNPDAAPRIKKYLPDVKLIAVLRHPVDRIYSDYLHERQAGRERSPDLRTALAANVRGEGFLYLEKSRYSAHLARYMDLFCPEQMHIALYDDFSEDPARLLHEMFVFLGVDGDFVPDTTVRSRASGVPRSALVNSVVSTDNPLKRLARAVLPRSLYVKYGYRLHNRNVTKPDLDRELRQELLEEFRPEVARVSSLIHRDLSAWLS